MKTDEGPKDLLTNSSVFQHPSDKLQVAIISGWRIMRNYTVHENETKQNDEINLHNYNAF